MSSNTTPPPTVMRFLAASMLISRKKPRSILMPPFIAPVVLVYPLPPPMAKKGIFSLAAYSTYREISRAEHRH